MGKQIELDLVLEGPLPVLDAKRACIHYLDKVSLRELEEMKAKKLFILIVSIAAGAFSAIAFADAPRYDLADVSYQTINAPSGSGFSSEHAYGLDGAYGFTDHIIGEASYSHTSADFTAFGLSGTASGNSYEAGDLNCNFCARWNVVVFKQATGGHRHGEEALPGRRHHPQAA